MNLKKEGTETDYTLSDQYVQIICRNGKVNGFIIDGNKIKEDFPETYLSVFDEYIYYIENLK